MTTIITLVSIVISTLGITYMNATDPKRRRGAKLPQYENRPLIWPARVALFGPGVLLIAMGNWAGLSMWGGAITVIGWGIAAISPAAYGQFHADMRARLINLGTWAETKSTVWRDRLHAAMPAPILRMPTLPWQRLNLATAPAATGGEPASGTVSKLEARIIALEARLHRLERENEQLRGYASHDEVEPRAATAKATRP